MGRLEGKVALVSGSAQDLDRAGHVFGQPDHSGACQLHRTVSESGHSVLPTHQVGGDELRSPP